MVASPRAAPQTPAQSPPYLQDRSIRIEDRERGSEDAGGDERAITHPNLTEDNMASFEQRRGGWCARVFLGRGEDGRQKKVAKVFRTKREAEAWARSVETKASTNSFVAPSKLTVSAYLRGWLDSTARARVKPQTHESYATMMRLHVMPEIGSIPLDRLMLSHVDALYVRLTSAKKLSPRSVRYIHAILRSALDGAMRSDLIYRNPCALATLPKSVKVERAFLDAPQSARFLAAASEDEWYPFWVLLLPTGARPSEALAIKWSDLASDALLIQRTVIRSGDTWRFDTPKTARSTRVVPLPTSTLSALKALRKEQAQRRLKLGDKWEDNDLIFTRAGAPLDLRSLTKNHFDVIVQRAGLDPSLSPYSLRHSHISTLLAQGVGVLAVAARVGHSSPKMTLDTYGHTSEADRRAVVDVLNRLAGA
jgi:integrase